ncbi:nicotinate-nucleotide adenylyltransferase [Capnocytophaga granulosa]|uniref:Probable nicotinate-nucleotide adenylyltransferase n=1 Tax=Capnocytophaga granulosa TaxID=45242 RepID=A0A1H2RX90_9FLAO|nr:nicotinate (nicotinamide) nucleotide adenylyltransferase [Capnocytophaga granulosa]EPD30170.1 nicotinate (nicotinamide) nucleotide adenylyltransferase [Capnocytophaga granulosa ATCC 51502]SDW23918.1 nicotinate-nucleotide adenylyltransferase [Capnocytophaga granulosa]SUX20495.1 Probable nicotinate-nucleotide adenylyltransferase [Capnocytophaga granulosa]
MQPKNIGLYFGSFNPIHIGHLILANYLAEHSDLDEIWLVVTPQNPFKDKKSLLDNASRLEMVALSLKEYDKLKPCDIEFHLPQPNYTIDTLIHLEEKYPQHSFSLIMGEDNLKSFHKWKNYQVILSRYLIYVYPRLSEGKVLDALQGHEHIVYIKTPIIELSATAIREDIAQGKDVRPMLPPQVWSYIDKWGFYK